eukprot:TRINITY_DN7383_c0_g1_i1.p2 TRINITY_DN7383_c0_g1~~TRINITY_DN7383_c0_g1_i1.p2  ORF type:complete len:118 (-),score=20.57 TRINITY_DN7383_c0_g1_i1:212-565(-)
MILALRSVGTRRRNCVVVQRMRRVAHRPHCVLSRYGCIRLAWKFARDEDDYPAIAVVDAEDILRAEDVQVDWADPGERADLFAAPSNQKNTPTERRAARFFTNVFFPWTSRDLTPGL